MIKTIASVTIKTTTWNKEAQGLFDYDSSNISDNKFEISSSTQVYKLNDEIFVQDDNSDNKELPEGAQNVLYLKKSEDGFSVCKNSPNSEEPADMPENLWKVVKSVNPSITSYKGHVLVEGDVIKLGKIKLRVRELKPLKEAESLESSPQIIPSNKRILHCSSETELPSFIKRHEIEKLPEGHEHACRVCLENEEDESNPLIGPCSCTGSVKHIHLGCLKTWIESKCATNIDDSCVMYMWKNLDCEICHSSLPDIFMHEGKEIHLLNLIKPETSYLILETLPEKQDIKKVFYVISITKDNKHKILKIGRKNDCEVKVNDISVSRLHAMIRLIDGKFYLENGFSKFGTLLLLQNETRLKKEYNLKLQIGRTVLNFELQTTEVVIPIEEPEQKEVAQCDSDVSLVEETKEVEEKFTDSYYMKNGSEESVQRLSSDCSQESQVESLDNTKNSSQENTPLSTAEPMPYISGQIHEDLKYVDSLLDMMRELLGNRYKTISDTEISVRKDTGIFEDIPLPSKENQENPQTDRIFEDVPLSLNEKQESAQIDNIESFGEHQPN